jgi:hypothetical protein
MILSISILIVIVLLIFLIFFFLSEDSKKDYPKIVFSLLLVLLGFALSLLLDNVKVQKYEKTESELIVTLLRLESSQNHGIITNNLKMIEKNIEFNDSGSFLIAPLWYLESNAWESAKLRNNLFIRNTKDLMQVQNLYTVISTINRLISYREQFILARLNTNERSRILKKFDLKLRQSIEKAKELNDLVKEFLYMLPPHEIKGPMFKFNKGRVVHSEEDKIE